MAFKVTMGFRMTAAMTTYAELAVRLSLSAKSRILDGDERPHAARPWDFGSPCLDLKAALLTGARPET